MERYRSESWIRHDFQGNDISHLPVYGQSQNKKMESRLLVIHSSGQILFLITNTGEAVLPGCIGREDTPDRLLGDLKQATGIDLPLEFIQGEYLPGYWVTHPIEALPDPKLSSTYEEWFWGTFAGSMIQRESDQQTKCPRMFFPSVKYPAILCDTFRTTPRWNIVQAGDVYQVTPVGNLVPTTSWYTFRYHDIQYIFRTVSDMNGFLSSSYVDIYDLLKKKYREEISRITEDGNPVVAKALYDLIQLNHPTRRTVEDMRERVKEYVFDTEMFSTPLKEFRLWMRHYEVAFRGYGQLDLAEICQGLCVAKDWQRLLLLLMRMNGILITRLQVEPIQLSPEIVEKVL
jgi:hypothetical protein